MKINFSNQTASLSATIPFSQMAVLEDALQTAALEAMDSGDAARTSDICELSDTLGIDLDLDPVAEVAPTTEGNESSTAGQDLESLGLPESHEA